MRPAAVLAAAVLALSGCGDDEPAAIVTTTSTSTTIAAPPTEMDCDVIGEEVRVFEAGVDLLVLVSTPAHVDDLRAGATDLDLGAFRASIVQLRAVEAIETPIGSVADMLDFFDRAAALAEAAVASDDAFGPDGPGTELAAIVADDATFIGNQGPVLFAVADAGCR